MRTTRKNNIPQVPSQLDPGIDVNPIPDSECPCSLKVSDFSHINRKSQFVFTDSVSELSPAHFKMPQLIAITQYLQFEGFLPKVNPNLH